ncbi:glutathione S-transferase [Catellatospora methionotrophica]|uniref:Glutathione S-transferase n=1 Tax=Catellatospora methionotrophica TaxID=121620 RepID=A0A8J3LI68_9ACTN|nr:DUF952 domain-containing protein [Catellatospora methionotrophica]GIG15606.1 glutathione S-transferase [Catellatospora methionotrophica]
MLIYKILLPSEWAALEQAGQFDGSPFDHASGFVHLSSRDQVAATALRVFGGEPELVVVAVDPRAVTETLRWEESRDRGVFPHVYGPLLRSAVVAVYRVAGAAAVDEALPR